MRREKFCYDCDTNFVVSVKGPYETKYCPFCGEEVSEDDVNDLIEPDDD